MNNEIREIYLSNLEWTRVHDNIGGVMGNIVFKDAMPYEEYQKLLKTTYFTLCDKDYTTNVEQESERLKNDVEDISCSHFSLFKSYKDYKSRVEKAIEDIEFCFRSIKQEADMSKDERTRHEMRTCLAIFNETLKSLKKGSDK